MSSNFEQLVFEIIARDKDASAAFDKFRRSVDDTSKSVDKNSKALDDNAKSVDKNKDSQRSWLGALAGAGLAFAPVTVGAAAAGAGVAAFSALAVPSVKKVAAALTDKNGLADSWMTLDNRQRNAALSVQALGRDYSDLAKQMEPQVFQVFNQGVALAGKLLGPVGQLAHSSGQGISDFLATFSANSGLQHFISYLSTLARPATALIGQDITHIAHAVFSLLESFGGTGLMELRALTTGLDALDHVVSFLSQHAPGLTSAALAIGGVALALSKLGLLSGVLKITGISSIAGQMAGFAAATEGATLAEKGLLATTTVLEAISPWAWAALGVGALGALIFSLRNVKSGLDEAIASMQSQDKATGFNIAGWQKLADESGKVSAAWQQQISTSSALGHQISEAKNAQETYSATSVHAQGVVRTLTSFLGVLQDKYGLTQAQAIRLAQASGVLIDKQGKLTFGFKGSIDKAEGFANANLAAQSPVRQLTKDIEDFSNKTLTATQRQTALTDALKLFFDPAVKADQDVITLKNDQASLATALANSGGKTGLLTQAQRDARGAFDTYINDVATAAQDAFAATGKQRDYNRIVHDALPELYAAAKGNSVLRGEVQKLKDTLKGLGPEHVALSVGATGTWTVTQFQAPGGGKHAVNSADGMLVTGGTPGRDSVLINAMPGEVVVPTSMVNAGAVDHLRGRIPGFADGGVVGSFKGSPPGLGRFLRLEDNQTLIALEKAVAAATFAGIKHAQATAVGGASGNAMVRYGESFLGSPYVWGGTTPAGWDCSGFTSWVYHHFGIPAPRTSQQQQLWASPSSDRPGALVFFYGTGGSATHVGLSVGNGTMVNAANPAVGTVISSTAGNSGFGVPPGSPGATGGGGGGNLPPGIRNGAQSFDRGGYLEPGYTLAYNGTGRPEPVGGGNTYNITVVVQPGANMVDAGRHITDAIRSFERSNGKGWRS